MKPALSAKTLIALTVQTITQHAMNAEIYTNYQKTILADVVTTLIWTELIVSVMAHLEPKIATALNVKI
jgi:hypothetical protein